MASPASRINRPESLYQQIARNIRNDIEAGTLRHNESLPSTRELAAQWGVSVVTINDAMKVLVDEGLVISKSRSKRIVNKPDQQVKGDVLLVKPHVVFIGGYAGSGKTALGRILAHETGWPMLDKDTLTRPVVEAALETLGQPANDRESEAYLSTVRPREYEALIDAMVENVECGNSAVVTAPFIREFSDTAWIGRRQAELATMKATATFVWVYCDADTMYTYLRHRGAARDAFKLANWSQYLAAINLDFRPVAPHTVIDNCASSTPLQDQAQELLKAVSRDE